MMVIILDLPIYYKQDEDSDQYLAHRSKDGWIISTPIEFIDWYKAKRKQSKLKKLFAI